MNADDIDRDQANRLHTALFPGVNFLVRLMQRMQSKGFPPADPLFKLVSAAYEWSYRLSMDLHYRSCLGAHQRHSNPSGDEGDLTEGDGMKTELRAKPHAVLPGVVTAELWHDGQFIGTVVGADGPVVRIITKHAVKAKPTPDGWQGHSCARSDAEKQMTGCNKQSNPLPPKLYHGRILGEIRQVEGKGKATEGDLNDDEETPLPHLRCHPCCVRLHRARRIGDVAVTARRHEGKFRPG